MTNRTDVKVTLLVGFLAIVSLSGPAISQVPSYFTAGAFYYSPPWGSVLTWTLPVAGDFDNDGFLDVATIMSAGPGGVIPLGDHIVLFRGTPAGALVGPIPSPQLIYGIGFGAARALDANADGNLDLIVRHGSSLVVYLGPGNGTFTISSTPVLLNTGRFDVGNLNGDAFPDLVSVSTLGATVGVYVGNGAGYTPSQTIAIAPSPSEMSLADVNGDGVQDVILAFASTFQVLQGLGAAAFAPAVSIAAGSTIQTFGPHYGVLYTPVGAFATGDVNKDGRDDVAFFGYAGSASSVRLMLGSASTLLQPSTVIAPGANGTELKIFDVDGDGNNDLVWQALLPTSPYTTYTASVVAALGNGAGGFSGPVSLTYAAVGYYPALLPVDLDADGDRDLATVSVQGAFTDNGGITPTQVGVVPNRASAGMGAAGTQGTPVISAGSSVVGNAAFAISVANAAPLQPMALGLAYGPVTGWNGFGTGLDPATLLPFPGAALGIALTMSDGLGTGSIPIPIPNAPVLQGFVAYAQWIVADPLGTFPCAGLSCSLSRVRTLIVQ